MDLGAFHGRRLARLLPVLYLMLFVGCLMGLPEIADGFWWHATFMTNFFTLTQDEWPGAASHLWSLSLQEQFYLLWPFFLLLVPKRSLPWVLLGLMGFALGFRMLCIHADASVFLRWVMLPGVIDSFAMGALVACWKVSPRKWNLSSGQLGFGLTVVAFAAYALARWLRFSSVNGPILAIVETLENLCLAWIVIRTTVGWRGWFGQLLQHPVLRYLGTISFGLYVFHVLVHVALGPWLTEFEIHNSAIRALILMAFTAGIAGLSWHSMEAPLSAWFRKPILIPRLSRGSVLRKPYREAE
jgi:peptidoglycan/LPS O-acetylase OafA/YrhL